MSALAIKRLVMRLPTHVFTPPLLPLPPTSTLSPTLTLPSAPISTSAAASEPNGSQSMCTVCQAAYEPGETHMHHVECATPWLLRHGTCPLCKYHIARPQLHRDLRGAADPPRARGLGQDEASAQGDAARDTAGSEGRLQDGDNHARAESVL